MTRLALLAPVLVLTACSLTGCGLIGSSWDVRVEVHGEGTADVNAEFAGEDAGPKAVTLPFEESRNVGFGFNYVFVDKAPPGTVCKIFVDDVLREEKTVDENGKTRCYANNQD
ncbi:hypothetical protein ACFFQW_13435 [Umezawaea endophytica]|uniref:Lipoprotein n=1 Tax=Umezawaea endophytica TaxID=1654476 RepID=A0A9X3A0K9_9PSEU|nr:hypothetical protein [Umezawaea endophytica]MCS7478664.1 hypothetical protein [Umezawaea endophytica]